MSISSKFGKLSTDGLEKSQDRLGGGYQPRESNAYTGIITGFYGGESKGGALSVTIQFKDGDKEYRETVYITNKKGENFFPNKQDPKKKVPMPGYVIANDICMMTTGLPFDQQDWVEKTINVYNKDAGKELPTVVEMAEGVLGQEVTLGILKELHNKSEQQSDGSWEETDETEIKNSINKVFHTETKSTLSEAEEGQEPSFYAKWVKQYADKEEPVDRRKKKGSGQNGRKVGDAPKSGDKSEAPTRKPLFSKK